MIPKLVSAVTIITLLSLSSSAYCAPCDQPQPILVGEVAPCDGLVVNEETANQCIEDNLRARECGAGRDICRSSLETCNAQLAVATKPVSFWRGSTAAFLLGIVVGAGLGVAGYQIISSR